MLKTANQVAIRLLSGYTLNIIYYTSDFTSRSRNGFLFFVHDSKIVCCLLAPRYIEPLTSYILDITHQLPIFTYAVWPITKDVCYFTEHVLPPSVYTLESKLLLSVIEG